MKRRNFLLGATAMTLPAWLGCAFGSKNEWSPEEEDLQKGSSISKAFVRAQQLGKPLLIWVVPPFPFSRESLNSQTEEEQTKYWGVSTERYERGHAFGELLNHGTEDQRWPLALCEVICALPEEIESLTGSFSGKPLMVLLETDTNHPTALSFDGALPTLLSGGLGFTDSEVPQTPEDQIINERIALLAKLIKDALAPNEKTIERRAKQLRSTRPEHKDLEKKISSQDFTIQECDLIAGIVGEVATKTKNKALFTLLAQAVDARLGKLPAEGSRWARSSGCGTTYEDPPKPKVSTNPDGSHVPRLVIGISCGMGHIPEKSQRFLAFYSEENV